MYDRLLYARHCGMVVQRADERTTIETIGLLDEDKEHARTVSKERGGGNNENAGGSTLESSSARMLLLSTIGTQRERPFHCVLLSACYEHDQIQNSL